MKEIIGSIAQIWTSAKAAIYRSEAELNDEATSCLPDPEDLRTITKVDSRVRTEASYPRLGEFYSRQVLVSLSVELVEEAPPYDIVRLQRQLRESDIPVIQIFVDTLVSRGNLGMNESLLFSGRDNSSFEVLIELGSDVGDVERWVRDFDLELLEHLRAVENDVDEGFDLEKYDDGERIATSITAHLERASLTAFLDDLLTQVEEEVDNSTVFRRYEPDWYLQRVEGSNHTDTAILTVSHRYRIDDEWHSGTGTDENEFTETADALQWLSEFHEDPPEYIETQ